MKMNALLIALPLLIGSCSDDNNSYNDPATVPTDIIQTVTTSLSAFPLTRRRTSPARRCASRSRTAHCPHRHMCAIVTVRT